jgi:hypothetical protein
MKQLLNRIANLLEDIAWYLRDKARTPDLSMPYNPQPDRYTGINLAARSMGAMAQREFLKKGDR